MKIVLENVGKRYATGWVFKNISFQISNHDIFSITGLNGTGKSTLVKIISGYLSHTKGKLVHSFEDKKINRDNIYKYCALSMAYAELDEELTVTEIFEHYKKFKAFKITDLQQFLELSQFEKERNKTIAHFSSGMKQRLSLALAFVMDTPLLLFDEPTSFLDADKKKWFHRMMKKFGDERTIVIATNDPSDLAFCTNGIEL